MRLFFALFIVIGFSGLAPVQAQLNRLPKVSTSTPSSLPSTDRLKELGVLGYTTNAKDKLVSIAMPGDKTYTAKLPGSTEGTLAKIDEGTTETGEKKASIANWSPKAPDNLQLGTTLNDKLVNGFQNVSLTNGLSVDQLKNLPKIQAVLAEVLRQVRAGRTNWQAADK